MKAIKENKVYTIPERLKKEYLRKGYDVICDDGTVEKSPAHTVSAKAYAALQEKYKALLEENQKLKKGAK